MKPNKILSSLTALVVLMTQIVYAPNSLFAESANPIQNAEKNMPTAAIPGVDQKPSPRPSPSSSPNQSSTSFLSGGSNSVISVPDKSVVTDKPVVVNPTRSVSTATSSRSSSPSASRSATESKSSTSTSVGYGANTKPVGVKPPVAKTPADKPVETITVRETVNTTPADKPVETIVPPAVEIITPKVETPRTSIFKFGKGGVNIVTRDGKNYADVVTLTQEKPGTTITSFEVKSEYTLSEAPGALPALIGVQGGDQGEMKVTTVDGKTMYFYNDGSYYVMSKVGDLSRKEEGTLRVFNENTANAKYQMAPHKIDYALASSGQSVYSLYLSHDEKGVMSKSLYSVHLPNGSTLEYRADHSADSKSVKVGNYVLIDASSTPSSSHQVTAPGTEIFEREPTLVFDAKTPEILKTIVGRVNWGDISIEIDLLGKGIVMTGVASVNQPPKEAPQPVQKAEEAVVPTANTQATAAIENSNLVPEEQTQSAPASSTTGRKGFSRMGPSNSGRANVSAASAQDTNVQNSSAAANQEVATVRPVFISFNGTQVEMTLPASLKVDQGAYGSVEVSETSLTITDHEAGLVNTLDFKTGTIAEKSAIGNQTLERSSGTDYLTAISMMAEIVRGISVLKAGSLSEEAKKQMTSISEGLKKLLTEAEKGIETNASGHQNTVDYASSEVKETVPQAQTDPTATGLLASSAAAQAATEPVMLDGIAVTTKVEGGDTYYLDANKKLYARDFYANGKKAKSERYRVENGLLDHAYFYKEDGATIDYTAAYFYKGDKISDEIKKEEAVNFPIEREEHYATDHINKRLPKAYISGQVPNIIRRIDYTSSGTKLVSEIPFGLTVAAKQSTLDANGQIMEEVFVNNQGITEWKLEKTSEAQGEEAPFYGYSRSINGQMSANLSYVVQGDNVWVMRHMTRTPTAGDTLIRIPQKLKVRNKDASLSFGPQRSANGNWSVGLIFKIGDTSTIVDIDKNAEEVSLDGTSFLMVFNSEGILKLAEK